mmetsp:Transcript_165/g.423  ORF Transcript_165/g.423 Transcript_165/m.423 type:complete len:209 (+) Transcript_165:199-825(+)
MEIFCRLATLCRKSSCASFQLASICAAPRLSRSANEDTSTLASPLKMPSHQMTTPAGTCFVTVSRSHLQSDAPLSGSSTSQSRSAGSSSTSIGWASSPSSVYFEFIISISIRVFSTLSRMSLERVPAGTRKLILTSPFVCDHTYLSVLPPRLSAAACTRARAGAACISAGTTAPAPSPGRPPAIAASGRPPANAASGGLTTSSSGPGS